MPSEKSFADRIGRFMRLKEACASMNPAFAPADVELAPAAQVTLLTALEDAWKAVMDAETELKDLTGPRVTLVKTIRERATRALNRVASNHAWAAKLPAVKAAGNKLRNFRPPSVTAPPPDAGAGAIPPPKRDRGGQSYRDIEGHLGKFIAALTMCSGYDTGAPGDIGTSALGTLLGELSGANSSIPEREVALSDAQTARRRLFESKQPLPDGSASLRDRWVRIKMAVKSQYGVSSAEYALVRRIKY
jgi:hypothetical protein